MVKSEVLMTKGIKDNLLEHKMCSYTTQPYIHQSTAAFFLLSLSISERPYYQQGEHSKFVYWVSD